MRGFEDHPLDWAPAHVRFDDNGILCQTIKFMVPGTPRPKGNVIKGRWGGYHDATKGLDAWSDTVGTQARCAMNGQWRQRTDPDHAYRLEVFSGPLLLSVTFVLPSPKTHTPPVWLKSDPKLYRLMFRGGIPPMLKKPDVDKCLRAVTDALTGVVWHDDSQVVECHARKRYNEPGEVCGAVITVTTSAWDGGW